MRRFFTEQSIAASMSNAFQKDDHHTASRNLFLGMNRSTPRAEALIMDDHGTVRATASTPLTLSTSKSLWSEQNHEEGWSGVASSVIRLSSPPVLSRSWRPGSYWMAWNRPFCPRPPMLYFSGNKHKHAAVLPGFGSASSMTLHLGNIEFGME